MRRCCTLTLFGIRWHVFHLPALGRRFRAGPLRSLVGVQSPQRIVFFFADSEGGRRVRGHVHIGFACNRALRFRSVIVDGFDFRNRARAGICFRKLVVRVVVHQPALRGFFTRWARNALSREDWACFRGRRLVFSLGFSLGFSLVFSIEGRFAAGLLCVHFNRGGQDV